MASRLLDQRRKGIEMSCEHAAADLGMDCEYCSTRWVKSDPAHWAKSELRAFGRELGYKSGGFADDLYWFFQERGDKFINVGVTAEDIANGDAIYLLVNEMTRVPA